MHFENLQIWNQAIDLYCEIHKQFTACRDWDLKSQILRAALSISANIAEGHDSGYDAEYLRFLLIAKRSCAEVRSLLHAAKRTGTIPDETGDHLINNAHALSAKIYRYWQAVKKNSTP
jgi:four helix bundle protein